METLLSKMKDGQSGEIVAVNAPKGVLRRRLFDMGVSVGATVDFIKAAPLGDPIEIVLRGYSLSLRKSEAQNVMVKLTRDDKSGGI